jgi:uncharacterized membrane protein
MRPLTTAGVLIGVGLGGLIDGILLHQILGWHHLVCSTATCQADTVFALKEQNTADGYFHLVVWSVTIAGIALLFRACRIDHGNGSWQHLVGGTLCGWGAFNFIEGIVDHQLLKIHHVLPGSPNEFLYDMLFLASGIGLLSLGATLVHRAKQRSSTN